MIDIKDQAKEIRKALKAEYPDTKFSVTIKRGGLDDAISIKWMDLPSIESVEQITSHYRKVDKCEFSGDILAGGNTYVRTTQELSEEFRNRIDSTLPEGIDNWTIYSHRRKAIVNIEKLEV